MKMAAPLFLAAALGLLIASAGPASAQPASGLQISPDGKRTLISKDVGTQRWAITLNADDGTVTGNVFASDGGAPSFVWCSETARTESDITFSCSGADPCPLEPCPADDEWSFIAARAFRGRSSSRETRPTSSQARARFAYLLRVRSRAAFRSGPPECSRRSTRSGSSSARTSAASDGPSSGARTITR